MTNFKTGLAALLIGAAIPMSAVADIALVISNPSDFSGRSVNRVNDGHRNLVRALDDNGYDVLQITNGARDDLVARIAELEEGLDDAERVLIVYSGDYFTSGGKTYLLPEDADTSTRTTAMTTSVPLELLMSLAGTRPTQSAVALGLSRQATLPGERASNRAAYDIPQGVMVIRGGARNVLNLLANDMLERARVAGEINPNRSRVTFEGLILPDFTLATVDAPATDPQEIPEAEVQEPADFAEETLWALARNGNNEAAYRLYLQRYPDGKYAADARRALGLPEPGSEPTPQEVEAALNLNRAARRQIQSDLTVLGYNTRGVDGIFGGGTRSAVRGWQDENAFEATGFLTAEQLARLDAQADIRREELRIEEERRAREQRRADQAFWRETGSSGREVDLRTYLNRFPDGIHADEAREELAAIERVRKEEADREAYAAARDDDTEAAYIRYLQSYPQGIHADEARKRISELRRDNADLDAVEQYRDQERALGLNAASVLVIEQRLRALGYQVGTVDGRLDTASRDAITLFQREQNLTPTGYLNSATIQRLILASSR